MGFSIKYSRLHIWLFFHVSLIKLLEANFSWQPTLKESAEICFSLLQTEHSLFRERRQDKSQFTSYKLKEILHVKVYM